MSPKSKKSRPTVRDEKLAVPPYFRSFPSALSSVHIAAQASDLTQARTIILCFSTEGSHTETSAQFRTGCFQPTASILWRASLHLLTYVHSPIMVIIHDNSRFVNRYLQDFSTHIAGFFNTYHVSSRIARIILSKNLLCSLLKV